MPNEPERTPPHASPPPAPPADGGGAGGPDVAAAADLLRSRLPDVPRVAAVLGSGLNHLADDLEDPVTVPFADLPGFPASGVTGHAGRWIHGHLAGTPLLVLAGRYHLYEGHPEEVVVAPTRILAALGVEILILTNAAGGLDPAREPGDLVLLDDHLNLLFRSPLAGPVHPGEERFPDMSAPWDPELQEMARAAAARRGVQLVRGVYAAVLGPSYETPAEVRMLRRLGGDVVGMSTVPELLAARAAGMRCLGFSMVTNKGTGYTSEPLSHEEVVEVGREAGRRLGQLLSELVPELAASSTGAK